MKLKHLFFSLLTLCLLAGYMGTSVLAYPDLPESHWAYDEIDRAASLRIMNGMQNGMMSPDSTLTWA